MKREFKVFVLSCQLHDVPFSDLTSVYHAEIWDPVHETFTAMATAATPRNYHSVAVRGDARSLMQYHPERFPS